VKPPNLFESLFDFHPREGHTPKENFLTEAFAYLLRTEREAGRAWLSHLLGRPVQLGECDVLTRRSERVSDSGGVVYPDLLLDGRLAGGERFAVYCEHKWDSPCNPQQLASYRAIVDKKGAHARLAFVGATHKQKAEARKWSGGHGLTCALWEDAYTVLAGLPDRPPLLKEFLEFMKTHGLTPVPPLTVEAMTSFLRASSFLGHLASLANRLNDGYPWDAVPERFHFYKYVKDAYGRVAIRFETDGWRPGLTLGLLYDGSDLQVPLINPERGIDLLLRIEAEPKNLKDVQPVLAVLGQKRDELAASSASVAMKGERASPNPYSLLVVRECLADVLERASGTDDQLGAVHRRLCRWLETLFGDGRLEEAFGKTVLSSGLT